jgi:uncharacterized protein
MQVVEAVKSVLASSPDVRLAVLFGSASRSTARPRSDIDVGVLMTEGADIGRLEVELGRAAGRTVDLIRLDTAPPLLRFEIARDGRVLAERTPHAWADFRARAMIDWWDWAPTARVLHRAALARLREQVTRGAP